MHAMGKNGYFSTPNTTKDSPHWILPCTVYYVQSTNNVSVSLPSAFHVRVIIKILFKLGASMLNVSHKETSWCQIQYCTGVGEFNEAKQEGHASHRKFLGIATHRVSAMQYDSCVNCMEKACSVLHFTICSHRNERLSPNNNQPPPRRCHNMVRHLPFPNSALSETRDTPLCEFSRTC